jgi:transcriptional regulator with PAS, ATPase and Fis domain
VRERENIVERAVALGDHKNIRSEDLPTDLQKLSIRSADIRHWPSLEEKEREYIRRVLMKTNHHRAAAAEILKIPRTTLWRKIKRYGIESPS